MKKTFYEEMGFSPVPVRKLHLNGRLPVSIFIFMPSDKKMLLYLPAKSVLEYEKQQQMFTFPDRFFVRKEDQVKLTRYLEQEPQGLAETLESHFKNMSKTIEPSAKQELQLKSVEVLFRELNFVPNIKSKLPPIEQLRRHIHSVVDDILNLLEIDTEIIKKLKGLQEAMDSKTWDHSLNVAAISVLLAITLGYTERKLLREIATGGYLHDVGIVYCNVPLPKRELIYSPSEMIRYREHPRAGHDLIENSGLQVSEQAKLIIFQHEERFDGSGFPSNISGSDIYPLAQIVAIADRLDHLIRIDEPGFMTFEQALLFLYQEALSKSQGFKYSPAILKQIVGTGIASGLVKA